MARKKSNAGKKSKSKRSSANTSPTPTPAAISSSVLEEDLVDVPESTQDSVDGDREPTETPEAPEQSVSDSGKYAVDVAVELSDSGADAATEDQLENPFVYAERSEEPHAPGTDYTGDYQLHVPDHAPKGPGSVNMEDSQAELLSSDMDHSMYRSSINHSYSDDLHALESGRNDLSLIADDSIDVVAAAAELSGSAIARPYVISPSAFTKEDESEDNVHIRPEPVAEQNAGVVVQESANGGAAEVASIMSSLIEAAAAVGLSVNTGGITCEVVEPSGERDLCSSGDLVSGGHSIAESFIHVEESVGDDCERTKDLDPESDSEPKAEEQGSEQVDRAVNEVMDNARDNAKDAANKATDTARNAGKKAERTASKAKDAAHDAIDDITNQAKEASDTAHDAADDISHKAKDLLDNASKSVRDAAASANGKAHDAINKARESGEKFAKKAKEEANEAEKAVRKQAKETPPATLRVLGVVAVALAAVSGYYFRLPGRQNQRIGFAGGVASVVIGLGTLATAFVKRNA
ncbi:hypothetical protein GGI18_002128 [Coemansia linderi]|uniref:Uncharacterized protein n=1 Tax=Coemansia linderi TaxID=2663919 RepID=A0ACC1KGW9_9FUNG|nr:hypothetical protein GGI18_002128 [Coemansia linderi]